METFTLVSKYIVHFVATAGFVKLVKLILGFYQKKGQSLETVRAESDITSVFLLSD